MNIWLTVGIVLLVLFLLLQIRIGVSLRYGRESLQLCVHLGLISIQVYPKQSRKEKREKVSLSDQKNQVERKQAEAAGVKGKKLTLAQLLELAERFIPLALEAAGCIWSKLVMDNLEVSVTVGSPDPADAAMLYGQINSGIAALWVPLNQVFHIKNGRTHADIDFEANQLTLYLNTLLSIRIGQVLWIAVYFGVRALKQMLQYQKHQEMKEEERKAV